MVFPYVTSNPKKGQPAFACSVFALLCPLSSLFQEIPGVVTQKKITGIFSCSVTAASIAMNFLALFQYGEWGGGRVPESESELGAIFSILFYY